MAQRCILVVEDDSAIRRGVVDALTFAGYGTLQSGDGAEAARLATTATIDLILLDLVLPKQGGFEILKAVRATRPTLPVIILTARGDESDRVNGLRLGADDYVVKPFSIRELLARVEAVPAANVMFPTTSRTSPSTSSVSGSIGRRTDPTGRPRNSKPRLITAIQSARSPWRPTVTRSTNGMISSQIFRAATKLPSSMQRWTIFDQRFGSKLPEPDTHPVAPKAKAPRALLSWP
jgi:CheY-like chemotaxis protein